MHMRFKDVYGYSVLKVGAVEGWGKKEQVGRDNFSLCIRSIVYMVWNAYLQADTLTNSSKGSHGIDSNLE